MTLTDRLLATGAVTCLPVMAIGVVWALVEARAGAVEIVAASVLALIGCVAAAAPLRRIWTVWP